MLAPESIWILSYLWPRLVCLATHETVVSAYTCTSPSISQPCNRCAAPTTRVYPVSCLGAAISVSQQNRISHLQNTHIQGTCIPCTGAINGFVEGKRKEKNRRENGDRTPLRLAYLSSAALTIGKASSLLQHPKKEKEGREKSAWTRWHNGPFHCNAIYGGEGGICHRAGLTTWLLKQICEMRLPVRMHENIFISRAFTLYSEGFHPI